ncbi:hypothetical protein ACLOJK_006120 [Asimina triloba]
MHPTPRYVCQEWPDSLGGRPVKELLEDEDERVGFDRPIEVDPTAGGKFVASHSKKCQAGHVSAAPAKHYKSRSRLLRSRDYERLLAGSGHISEQRPAFLLFLERKTLSKSLFFKLLRKDLLEELQILIRSLRGRGFELSPLGKRNQRLFIVLLFVDGHLSYFSGFSETLLCGVLLRLPLLSEHEFHVTVLRERSEIGCLYRSFWSKMVAFGKKLKERQFPEWQGLSNFSLAAGLDDVLLTSRYYINYKLMKKKVKQYAQQIQVGDQNRRRVMKEFSRMLDNQFKSFRPSSCHLETSAGTTSFAIEIEKIVLFLLEQQGLLASRIEKLGERHAILQQQPVISEITQLREEYREVGRDLLKLLFFVDINAIGLRKILKKFDKRLGYRFTDYYVTTRANHPYSQLQQVFKHVGIGAVVGALSRNLSDLQDRQGSYWSIYDQPSITLQDPVIDSIKVAVDRLTHSTNFLHFLGQHALIMQEEELPMQEDRVDDEKYHFMSLALNLANTFLYMVNTYIIVPTADNYALSLGAAATVCGVIIGSMAVAQVFSSVYFSAWSNKSYFRPLIFSSVVLFVGNVLYALAYDVNSIALLLIGRLFCGLGSARAVNRRYISDCVPLKIRMQASAAFVTASALGMAIGPALASIMQIKFKLFIITFNEDTMPGWVMALAWLLYLIWLLISFKEPSLESEENHQPQEANPVVEAEQLEGGLKQPLLLNSEENKKDEDEGQECDGSEEAPEESRKPANSIASAYRLLTPSVKVQLLIYFMLKYAMEILLSESSVITTYYFNWSTTTVAIFLGCLGITVLPVNIVVGSYITNLFEDRQILLASEIIVCIGILLSFHVINPYSVPQYVCSALITFVSAEVLEGVNLSLLSRVMSSRLARGTYNGGLLSTEAGTLARVVADGTITLAGYLGQDKLLNMALYLVVELQFVSGIGF